MAMSPNLFQILEVIFQLLSVAVGVIVVLLALRTAPTLTLSSHRHTMQIFILAAVVVVSSEFVGVLAPFFRVSTSRTLPKNSRSWSPYLLWAWPCTL